MKLETEWVQVESGGHGVPAYRARPPGARTPLPAVVVIQEVWGVDDHIEDVANRFAAAGYEALAPDLWSGTGARPEILTRERVNAVRAFLAASPAAWSSPEARQAALAQLPEAQRDSLAATMGGFFGSDEGRPARFARYLEIVQGAVAFLRPADRKVGSVGFCMGGGLSGMLAVAEPTLSAAVVFYGTPPAAEGIPRIACPVLGHYGDPDPRITPSIPAFAEAMAAAGKSFEHHVYAAPHAFFNDTSLAYRPDAARAAWARTLAFFLAHLS